MNACDRHQKPLKENPLNILRFQTNTPTEVALNSPQGTIVEGRYGDRVLFHLTDGRVMYVPPIVARKIEVQGIQPGEPFELCKTQVKNGRLRSIEWWLRRLHAESPDGDNAEIPAEPRTDLESQLVQSIAAVPMATVIDLRPPRARQLRMDLRRVSPRSPPQ
jgi:hypothetical protein